MRTTLTMILGVLASAPAAAQQVNIQIDETKASAAGVDAADLEDQLNAALDGQLHLDDLETYMVQMANASVLATKGMGVDYASNPQTFVFGASMGSAASGSGVSISRGGAGLPDGGFAFQVMALAGLNLGAFADEESFSRRFVIYANGMSLSNQREPFSSKYYNYGAHFQANLVKPQVGSTVEWGGVSLTTGYEFATYALGLESAFPIAGDGATWDATGTYTISASTTSIPFELSTNVRVLIATVFVGGAYDVNQKSFATTAVGLDGDVYVDGYEPSVGRASVSAATAGNGAPQTIRAFGGVQANIFMVKAYVHANYAVDGTVGGHVGVRVAM